MFFRAKNTARAVSEVNKTFAYETVKGVVAAALATGVLTMFDIYKPAWVIFTYTMVHMFSCLRLTQVTPRVARAL